jgi:hypothetical protein
LLPLLLSKAIPESIVLLTMLFTSNLAISGSCIKASMSQKRHAAKRGLPKNKKVPLSAVL